jgi:hypothetical protein
MEAIVYDLQSTPGKLQSATSNGRRREEIDQRREQRPIASARDQSL